MSSPLFILSPEDSLLEAHQEMRRRHVRRLEKEKAELLKLVNRIN